MPEREKETEGTAPRRERRKKNNVLRSMAEAVFSRYPNEINLTSPTLSSCASSIILGGEDDDNDEFAIMARGRRGRSAASCFPGDAPMNSSLSLSLFRSKKERRAFVALLHDLDLASSFSSIFSFCHRHFIVLFYILYVSGCYKERRGEKEKGGR